MRKKTIATFFIISTILFLVGIALYFVGIANAAITLSNASSNGTTTYSPTDVQQAVGSTNGGLILGGLGLLLAGSAVFLVSWIGALVATAKRSSWGWFVCILLFQWITVLIYLFAGPAVDAPVAMQYQQYPQNPQYQQYPQNPQYPQQ